MAEIVRAKGVFTFSPKDTAPDFVLGTLCLNIDELIEFVNGEGKQYLTDYKGARQLKLNVTKMKDKRGIMVSVDSWKPTPKTESNNAKVVGGGTTERAGIATDDGDSTLPF